jgi:crotonobetainyl-CoA:carnitine CoA-transferase CaiB-like acyl-CoA transferase
MTGPLAGLQILDLSRILAGPTCTQLLGDLGADVIKIERPGRGDDTRAWGPPFLKDESGNDTNESAYYLAANRSKRSAAIDISQPDGVDLIRRLAARSDVLVENFKTGDLDRRGLGYDQLKVDLPRLVYCSISGFGRTGARASKAGYDFLIQGMGGIMSITGPEDGPPYKAGVGIADVMCGMYAATGILAALRHRDLTGEGQHIDLALLDSQIAWLINAGTNYLTSGETPERLGNGHPNIVPYQVFPTENGHFILAIGNDDQFARFCAEASAPGLSADPRFATNANRVRNRKTLIPLLDALTVARSTQAWIDALDPLGVPCGPVRGIDEVFEDPETRSRNMRIEVDHPLAETADLIGNPLNMSGTPVDCSRAPPLLGADTQEVLRDRLGLDDATLSSLAEKGVIAMGPAA